MCVGAPLFTVWSSGTLRIAQLRLGEGRGVGAADELVTGDDLALLLGSGAEEGASGGGDDDGAGEGSRGLDEAADDDD